MFRERWPEKAGIGHCRTGLGQAGLTFPQVIENTFIELGASRSQN